MPVEAAKEGQGRMSAANEKKDVGEEQAQGKEEKTFLQESQLDQKQQVMATTEAHRHISQKRRSSFLFLCGL